MKKILFINLGPFGSLTDTYYYYLNLKAKYNLTYIGFYEDGMQKSFEDITIIHLQKEGNSLSRRYRLIKRLKLLLNSTKFNFILVNYFTGCSILNLFERKSLVVDIRTSFITPNKLSRMLHNIILSLEVMLFRNITVISEGLKHQLHLPKKTHILPLGGNLIGISNKNFNELRILYVGTFHERNIVNTIIAFSRFILNEENCMCAHYTIIGTGSDFDIENIKGTIHKLGMERYITYKGEIRYPELSDYLKISNVGMSYIPIKAYYDNQPPTKTFEYLLSGMVVIATGTKENKKVITNNNGRVIGDDIEEIVEGLKYIYINRFKYNSETIQKESQKYCWDNIVKGNLIPYIESFN